MKKRRPPKRNKTRVQQQATNLPQKEMSPSIPQRLLSRWSGKLAALLGSLLALLTTVCGAYQIADGVRTIYFQTFPEIDVVGSDPQRPFSLPFYVKNPIG